MCLRPTRVEERVSTRRAQANYSQIATTGPTGTISSEADNGMLDRYFPRQDDNS